MRIAEALGRLGPKAASAVPLLRELAADRDADAGVRLASDAALGEILRRRGTDAR